MTDVAASPGTPHLVHAYEHRAYPLAADRVFSIGRDAACDVTVNEVAVSRRHAEIREEDGNFFLHPLGSTGTILDGFPVTAPHRLREGDTFLIGTMRFAFTRERLPVAMGIARPDPRESSVEERRPTLTFPSQPNVPATKQVGSRLGLWIGVLIAVAVSGAGAYALLLHR